MPYHRIDVGAAPNDSVNMRVTSEGVPATSAPPFRWVACSHPAESREVADLEHGFL